MMRHEVSCSSTLGAVLSGLLLAACQVVTDEAMNHPGEEPLGELEAAVCSGSSFNALTVTDLSMYQGELAGNGTWEVAYPANAVRMEFYVDSSLYAVDERAGASGTWYFSASGIACGLRTFHVKAYAMVIDSSGNRTTCWSIARTVRQSTFEGCSYPCADGTTEQTFGGGMAGCAGSVSWISRDTLCAPGWRTATAAEWVAARGTKAPAYNYWTDQDLKYSGTGSSACLASVSSGTACPAGQPMRVCAGATDALGNQCNWTNCGLESTTPNQYFGGCVGNSTAGSLCVPAGCADGSVEQTFGASAVGCAGTVTWDNRANLCAPGWRPVTAAEWTRVRGSAVPAYNYWTDEDLKYSGSNGACAVSVTTGYSCFGSPMRICTTSGTDSWGNQCNWTNCGLNSNTPNQYFGGCVGNTTAGVVCVPSGCADGTAEQGFGAGMVGCAGSVTWADRDQLCSPGWSAVSASEWVSFRGGAAPSHNYWTRDNLKYDGIGSSMCSVSTTTGYSCPAGWPMRVCSGATDPEGNTCTWTHCGLNSNTPDEWFGGCQSGLAGTLCRIP